jgi:hypothetical protein
MADINSSSFMSMPDRSRGKAGPGSGSGSGSSRGSSCYITGQTPCSPTWQFVCIPSFVFLRAGKGRSRVDYRLVLAGFAESALRKQALSRLRTRLQADFSQGLGGLEEWETKSAPDHNGADVLKSERANSYATGDYRPLRNVKRDWTFNCSGGK